MDAVHTEPLGSAFVRCEDDALFKGFQCFERIYDAAGALSGTRSVCFGRQYFESALDCMRALYDPRRNTHSLGSLTPSREFLSKTLCDPYHCISWYEARGAPPVRFASIAWPEALSVNIVVPCAFEHDEYYRFLGAIFCVLVERRREKKPKRVSDQSL